jgi:cellulose synthase/poly-beta-1,6-N-acetylglucosamine synthase-like glycosyltransferase
VLVRTGRVAPAQLEDALIRQREQDAPLGRILVVDRLISGDALTDALSEQSTLPRVDLDTVEPDHSVLATVDPRTCMDVEAIPCRDRLGRRLIAISNPAKRAAALHAFAVEGAFVEVRIAPADAIRQTIARHFAQRMVREAEQRCPEELSCRSLVSSGFSWRKQAALVGLATGIALAPVAALQLVLAWLVLANAMTMGLRLAALFAHLGARPRPQAGPEVVELRQPSVSVLVPLKEEAAVAGQLMAALGRMDYPEPLLDIKLVLEAGDDKTREAIERAGMPPTVEVLTVPAGTIKTKPRAMNYALPFCRGEIVGVYDAEDVPDPGQIGKVVRHLAVAPPDVACVQGFLDFYNADHNWLSRCFTMEYAIWFRVLLLGIQRLGLPIPLGGTTVFFRRRILEDIGAWDAHNVTEDADLGMRLFRAGYRCEMIATTTKEEANCASMREWVKQRSRWLKGYAITWATHMRRPGALLHDLGVGGFLGFQVLFLGGMTSYLAMPLCWLLLFLDFGFEPAFWDQLLPGIRTAFIVSMGVGQLLMLLTAIASLAAADRRRMVPWIPMLLPYWSLGAIAAYRAIAEVFYAPFLWHKTRHGDHLSAAGSQGR